MEALILASGSAARLFMLQSAGVPVIVDKPEVDEGGIKKECRSQGLAVEQTAAALALAKGVKVSSRRPGSLVLAADQMLDRGGDWFDKPTDRIAAARQLALLSGRSHHLVSSAVLVRDGMPVWCATKNAQLTMRRLTVEYIDDYLCRAGPDVLGCVGAYQVESIGIQLFEAIEGDYFAILGLPLLPLLAYLREIGAMVS